MRWKPETLTLRIKLFGKSIYRVDTYLRPYPSVNITRERSTVANWGLENFGIVYFASVLNRIRYQGAQELLKNYISPRVLRSWDQLLANVVLDDSNLISRNSTLISLDGTVKEINSNFFQTVPSYGFNYTFFFDNPEDPNVITYNVWELEGFRKFDDPAFFGADGFYVDYAEQLVACEGIFLELIDPNLSLINWGIGSVFTGQFHGAYQNINKRAGSIRDYLCDYVETGYPESGFYEDGFAAQVCKFFEIDPRKAMKMGSHDVYYHLYELFEIVKGSGAYDVAQRPFNPLVDWPRHDDFKIYQKRN